MHELEMKYNRALCDISVVQRGTAEELYKMVGEEFRGVGRAIWDENLEETTPPASAHIFSDWTQDLTTLDLQTWPSKRLGLTCTQ